MTINYATQYQQALVNAFPKVLHFGALWNVANASKYKPVDAKTIKLPVLDTTGRVEGSRGSITVRLNVTRTIGKPKSSLTTASGTLLYIRLIFSKAT